MENYKQKYEQALEQAKQELRVCGSLDCDGAKQIVRIFPELKESEDERIRKEIIHLVKKSNEYGGYALHKDEADRMISWLEKQGKQSPVEELKQEQKEQTINKACEWLKENIYNRVYKCNDSLGFPTATFLEDFKKAMEDEQ